MKRIAFGILILGVTVGGGLALGQAVHPLDRHIHNTPADYDGRIVYICETRPREYCSADGATCYLEADVYISDSRCPTIRIK